MPRKEAHGHLTDRQLILILIEGVATIMADLEGIDTALANLSTQISQLADQVAALEAGTVTQAELDTIAANIQSAADAVDAIIEPDAGETPTP
jgi:hypothetical protein